MTERLSTAGRTAILSLSDGRWVCILKQENLELLRFDNHCQDLRAFVRALKLQAHTRSSMSRMLSLVSKLNSVCSLPT